MEGNGFRGFPGEACESKSLLFFLLHNNLRSHLPFSQIFTLSGSHVFLLKPSRNAGIIPVSQQQSLLTWQFLLPFRASEFVRFGKKGKWLWSGRSGRKMQSKG